MGGSQASSLLVADALTLGYTNDQTAYLLASAQWESNMGSSMTEKGSSDYLSQYDGNSALGNTQSGDGVLFRGRGYIQITGRGAYTGWSTVLGTNLVANPALAANPDIAAQIASEGSFRSLLKKAPFD
jgi:predicted chitinase